MTQDDCNPIYCGSSLDRFHTSYKDLHGYVSLIVCILGTIANSLNIIVLTRREMRSPTNAILTGLAVADLAVMIEYMPYTIHDYILSSSLPREERLSHWWACFIKFHSIYAQVLHTISIWLTVTLAVWRYVAVVHPQQNSVWCNMRTTMITIGTAYIVCILVVSPSLYLVTSVAEFHETLDMTGKTVKSVPLSQYVIDYLNETQNKSIVVQALESAPPALNASAFPTTTTTTTTTAATTTAFRNITVYRLFHSNIALHNKSLQTATFLIYSVLIKLIPCLALTVLSIRLICALLEAKRRRKMLTSGGMKPLVVNGQAMVYPRKNSKTLEKEKQTDRTTRMLLAVLLLFLITEFPQGIMGLLNTMLGDAFLMQCYLKLSDLMDTLALINSSINFILYCSMSQQFRATFALLFRPRCLDKWRPVAQSEDCDIVATAKAKAKARAMSSTATTIVTGTTLVNNNTHDCQFLVAPIADV